MHPAHHCAAANPLLLSTLQCNIPNQNYSAAESLHFERWRSQEKIMAITYNGSLDAGNKARSAPGFARRLLNTLVEARQREANRRVSAYLRNLSDETLKEFGYTEAEIQRLRSF
jgi:hypothetical protein